MLGVLLSLVGLWIFFKEQSLQEIKHGLASANYLYLVFSMIGIVFSVFIRAWRWQNLLPKDSKVTLMQSYKATMIGNMGNNILPIRLGEIARLIALRSLSGMRIIYSLSSIAVERVFDLLMLILLFFTGWIFIPDSMRDGISAKLIMIFYIFTIILILSLLIVYLFRNATTKFGTIIQNIFHNLQQLFQTTRWIKAFAISLILWMIYLLTTILVLYAFHLPKNQLLMVGLIYLIGSSVAYSIPSAPGAVWTYHAASAALLSGLIGDISFSVGSAVFMMHANVFILFTLLGIIHMLSLDFGFRDIIKNRRKYE